MSGGLEKRKEVQKPVGKKGPLSFVFKKLRCRFVMIFFLRFFMGCCASCLHFSSFSRGVNWFV